MHAVQVGSKPHMPSVSLDRPSTGAVRAEKKNNNAKALALARGEGSGVASAGAGAGAVREVTVSGIRGTHDEVEGHGCVGWSKARLLFVLWVRSCRSTDRPAFAFLFVTSPPVKGTVSSCVFFLVDGKIEFSRGEIDPY